MPLQSLWSERNGFTVSVFRKAYYNPRFQVWQAILFPVCPATVQLDCLSQQLTTFARER
ncbi:hypothetical protein DESC_810043 [Desulfosarcina cetonica]|nr:hypothetical protein DESC_810043 [Desulfosarcina cetonica]